MIFKALVMILHHSCLHMIPTVFIFHRKNATSTRQDKVKAILRCMAKTILSLHIGKTELLHFLNCWDKSVKMANTTMSPTKCVKYLGVHLDKRDLQSPFQNILGKMAKHVLVV